MIIEPYDPKKRVLVDALIHASIVLRLTDEELANALGLEKTSDIMGLKDNPHMSPDSPIGKRGLELISLSIRLSAKFGNDEGWIHHFMRNPNQGTGGIPVEQIQTLEGLQTVLEYLIDR